MGLTEGFVPYQILKKAGWMIVVWRLKITFGHVQQASSKIFWQILKQLLKLLTSTFILLLILTGKGAAVLRQEIFKKTSLMCLFQWNLINLPELSVAQISPKRSWNTVPVLKNPQRSSSSTCNSLIKLISVRCDLGVSPSPLTSLSCKLHSLLVFFLMWK